MDTRAVTTSSSQLLGPMPQEKLARLKKAAEGMEAQLFQQVLSEVKSASSSESSFAAQTFRGMMNETLCRSMAEAGTLGLSDLLVRQFKTQATLDTPTPAVMVADGTTADTATQPAAQPETQP